MLPTAESLEGKPVPDVTFKARPNDQWREITSAELFKGRNVIVFSLPGAYTPTCSSSHLPRYNDLAPEFRRLGVDDIICMSVNDAFVMNEWKSGQDAGNITFIPDGNGDFSRAMGLLVDKRAIGFGERSWRYSMLVRDGVIEKMFIEPEKEGDPFEVSDAETMLRFLAPGAEVPEPVVLFAKPGCPHCARAKAVLDQNNVPYHEITQSQQVNSSVLRGITGKSTWPQLFVGGKLVGDADAIEAYYGAKSREG